MLRHSIISTLWITVLLSMIVADAFCETSPPSSISFTWLIKSPPPKLVLLFDRATSFAVTTGDVPATNVRIVHSSLQDPTTGAQLGAEYLQLCLPGAIDCNRPMTINPNTTQRIQLQVSPSFGLNGTFSGTVFLATDQKAEMDSFDLTVLSTSRSEQILGALLVLAGIILSWFVTVFVRHRTLRAEALAPVSELGGTLGELITELENMKSTFPRMLARLKQMVKNIDPPKLESEGLLLPLISNPFTPSMDPGLAYKQFLTQLSSDTTALTVVIRQGIDQVRSATGNEKIVANANKQLDELGESVGTVDEAKASIAKIISDMPKPPPGVALSVTRLGDNSTAALPSPRELRVQISRLSLSVWVIWGLLTWSVGIVALITTNYGFGAGLDYFKCFFWGLGVQVAGGQLQQLVPTSIGSAFTIAVPKI